VTGASVINKYVQTWENYTARSVKHDGSYGVCTTFFKIREMYLLTVDFPRRNRVVRWRQSSLITTQCTHQHTRRVNIATSLNFLTSIYNIQHDALDLHHTTVNTYILDFAHDSIDGGLRPKHVDA
jgi:hypothetical protein